MGSSVLTYRDHTFRSHRVDRTAPGPITIKLTLFFMPAAFDGSGSAAIVVACVTYTVSVDIFCNRQLCEIPGKGGDGELPFRFF